LHECRARVDDNVFLSKLIPNKTLRLLDLTEEIIEKDYDVFTSLDIAIRFLFFAGKHSYYITRAIGKEAKRRGFDGIIYTSYFNQVRTGIIPYDTLYTEDSIRDHRSQLIKNLAIFGRPIKESKIKVECINKVLINKVAYETTFGPVINL
jgi:hypothetical protein